METTQGCFRVSVLAALCLASCAGRLGPSAPAVQDPPAIEFYNESIEPVRVYLLGVRGEWHLGLVESSQSARLRLPQGVSLGRREAIRLAVIPGTSRSMQPSIDRRAFVTIGEPLSDLLVRRWIFTAGHLMSQPQFIGRR